MAALSVMTWNLRNFFPVGTKIGPQSQSTVSQADFDQKASTIADVIGDKDPDIVALQELGGDSASDTRPIDDLQTRLGKYPHRSSLQLTDGRHIRVAFLSKLPLEAETSIVDFPAGPLGSIPTLSEPRTTMGRGAIKVEIEPVQGTRIRLITCHLKSKLLTFPATPGGIFQPADEDERANVAGIALFRRAAEAVAIRRFVNDAMDADPGVHTVVLGDLNDEPLAATTLILLGPEDRDVKTADSGDPVRLFNITDALPIHGANFHHFLDPAERFTRVHEGRGELIDHIIVSKGLLVQNGDYAVDSVRSFVGEIDKTDGSSDHAPVMATFDL